MIPNYEKKYEHLWEFQDGKCAITGEPMWKLLSADMHHLIPNTKPNAKAYPQFIESVWNLRLVDHDAHMSKPLPDRLPLFVAERVEKHLEDHPDVAALINMALPGWHSVFETQNLLRSLWVEVWPERSQK